MKTLATILVTVLLASLLVGIWYIEKKDFVSIPKTTWDSIQKVASTPPDTIRHIDTIFAPGMPVTIIQEVPVYIKENDSTLCYNDSLKNNDLAIFLSDKISTKGIILDRVWKYKLFVPLRIIDSITITKLVPVPIEYNTTRYKYYFGAGTGCGSGLAWKIEGGINKGRFAYGAEYIRFNQGNLLLVAARYNF